MAQFNDSQITEKGHQLLAKVLSGSTELKFTKIQAGDGYFEGDVWTLTNIISPKLDGKILGVKPIGRITEIEGLITNEKLTEFFSFRELGIYAAKPDEGEILFAYTNAGDRADYIAAFNGQWLAEEHFTIQVYTANASNITAQIIHTSTASEIAYNNQTSGLNATNIQEAIDELKIISSSNANESVSRAMRTIFRRMQSGIEPFDVSFSGQLPTGDIEFDPSDVAYSNPKFPEVTNIKEGLDITLNAVQHMSWDG